MAAAMAVLSGQNAEFFIHCGDVGGERVIDQLAGKPSAFVWGNNDFDRPTLAQYAQSLGISCLDEFGDLTLAGKRFAILHGDDSRLREQLLLEQRHDYMLQGHTHIRQDQRVGAIRMINPGALFRAAKKTVAVLDTATDRLSFLAVNVPGR